MNNTVRAALCFTAIAAVLSGCQQAPGNAFGPDTSASAYYDPAATYGVPMADIAQVSGQPAIAGQVPPEQMAQMAQANQMAMNQMAAIAPAAGPSVQRGTDISPLLAEITALTDRLQRVEKAMLRLDRRMQLVERNELGRMTGNGPAPQDDRSAFNDDAPLPTPAVATVNVSSPDYGGPQYLDGFRAVSSNGNEGMITSSLQAAPKPGASIGRLADAAPRPSGLPSLADREPAAGKVPDGDLSIWTVKYGADKVWPDREQLPGSKDVVGALRSGQNVTLFARGKFPNAVAFRERVKAISRYLSKVTSLDSVPIAAIPAPQMDEETIEIFATH